MLISRYTKEDRHPSRLRASGRWRRWRHRPRRRSCRRNDGPRHRQDGSPGPESAGRHSWTASRLDGFQRIWIGKRPDMNRLLVHRRWRNPTGFQGSTISCSTPREANARQEYLRFRTSLNSICNDQPPYLKLFPLTHKPYFFNYQLY